jgi:thymidylate kinase
MRAVATVALIGADGAGKSTICRRLEGVRPPPMKYIYMGDNPEASNYALPTTRAMQRIRVVLGKEKNAGGPPDPSRSQVASAHLFKRLLSGFKSTLVLMNRMGEEWFRQCLAWYYQRRGYVVLFDRHFFSDYYAHDIAPTSRGVALTRRFHGFVLDRLYPKPDLMILLDAPASVLFARKGEGSVSLLESRRQEYLRLKEGVENVAVVDATRSEDDVARDVVDLIRVLESRDGR